MAKTKKKKKSMNKTVDETEAAEEQSAKGEQLDLIEVGPENARVIIQHARLYKAAQRKRLQALEEETTEKQALLGLIRKANLKRLDNGNIKFSCDGFTITVEPHDELIKIKELDETE